MEKHVRRSIFSIITIRLLSFDDARFFFRKDISKPKAIVTAKLQRQINSGKRISNERQKTTTENEGRRRRRGHERNNQLLGEKNTRRHNRGGKNQRLDCIKLITNNS